MLGATRIGKPAIRQQELRQAPRAGSAARKARQAVTRKAASRLRQTPCQQLATPRSAARTTPAPQDLPMNSIILPALLRLVTAGTLNDRCRRRVSRVSDRR